MTIGIAEPGRTVGRRVAVCEVRVAQWAGAREGNGA
jgi:hypothetical protein